MSLKLKAQSRDFVDFGKILVHHFFFRFVHFFFCSFFILFTLCFHFSVYLSTWIGAESQFLSLFVDLLSFYFVVAVCVCVEECMLCAGISFLTHVHTTNYEAYCILFFLVFICHCIVLLLLLLLPFLLVALLLSFLYFFFNFILLWLFILFTSLFLYYFELYTISAVSSSSVYFSIIITETNSSCKTNFPQNKLLLCFVSFKVSFSSVCVCVCVCTVHELFRLWPSWNCFFLNILRKMFTSIWSNFFFLIPIPQIWEFSGLNFVWVCPFRIRSFKSARIIV